LHENREKVRMFVQCSTWIWNSPNAAYPHRADPTSEELEHTGVLLPSPRQGHMFAPAATLVHFHCLMSANRILNQKVSAIAAIYEGADAFMKYAMRCAVMPQVESFSGHYDESE
jgi:hypothetical protein